MSETCSGSIYSRSFTREGTGDADPFVSVGLPVPGMAIRIVDDQDRLISRGQVRLQNLTG